MVLSYDVALHMMKKESISLFTNLQIPAHSLFLIDSGLNSKEAVVFDNLVIELAEDVPVVVDKLQELPGDRSQVILADGKAGRNLRIEEHLHWKFFGQERSKGIFTIIETYLRDCFTPVTRDQLFAEVHNPLLEEVTNPLVWILYTLDLFME